MKLVENSDVFVVYQLDKYFKMASNSEELLVSDDMERILLVIESDILAEPNHLEAEFAAKVSKMQDINSESRFMRKHRKSI